MHRRTEVVFQWTAMHQFAAFVLHFCTVYCIDAIYFPDQYIHAALLHCSASSLAVHFGNAISQISAWAAFPTATPINDMLIACDFCVLPRLSYFWQCCIDLHTTLSQCHACLRLVPELHLQAPHQWSVENLWFCFPFHHVLPLILISLHFLHFLHLFHFQNHSWPLICDNSLFHQVPIQIFVINNKNSPNVKESSCACLCLYLVFKKLCLVKVYIEIFVHQ